MSSSRAGTGKASSPAGALPQGKNLAFVRSALLALGLSGAMMLSGCSGFTPVYGDRSVVAERDAFRYADPTNRNEQIIYQELALRFGQSADPMAPLVRISTTSFSRGLTRSAVNSVNDNNEAVVNAVIELIGPDGKSTMKVKRSAAALYTTDSQALASYEAERDAYDRAARELAETIRLTLIGATRQPVL